MDFDLEEGLTDSQLREFLKSGGASENTFDLENGLTDQELRAYLKTISPASPQQSPQGEGDLSTGPLLSSLGLRKPAGAPIKGTITQGFDTPVDYIKGRKVHGGLDIAAPQGTPVPDLVGGTVIEARNSGGWGNQVLVKGTDGITRRYAHLNNFNVKKGQQIRPGDVIGSVGSTGNSTGPHLHYEELGD